MKKVRAYQEEDLAALRQTRTRTWKFMAGDASCSITVTYRVKLRPESRYTRGRKGQGYEHRWDRKTWRLSIEAFLGTSDEKQRLAYDAASDGNDDRLLTVWQISCRDQIPAQMGWVSTTIAELRAMTAPGS